VDALLASAGDGTSRVRTAAPDDAIRALLRAGATVSVTGPDTLEVVGIDAGAVARLLTDAGVPFHGLEARRPTLEQVYLGMTTAPGGPR
jgi:ABC-2 type transport system ATP-binding protein